MTPWSFSPSWFGQTQYINQLKKKEDEKLFLLSFFSSFFLFFLFFLFFPEMLPRSKSARKSAPGRGGGTVDPHVNSFIPRGKKSAPAEKGTEDTAAAAAAASAHRAPEDLDADLPDLVEDDGDNGKKDEEVPQKEAAEAEGKARRSSHLGKTGTAEEPVPSQPAPSSSSTSSPHSRESSRRRSKEEDKPETRKSEHSSKSADHSGANKDKGQPKHQIPRRRTSSSGDSQKPHSKPDSGDSSSDHPGASTSSAHPPKPEPGAQGPQQKQRKQAPKPAVPEDLKVEGYVSL